MNETTAKNGFSGIGSDDSRPPDKKIVICFDLKLLGISGADFTITEDGGLTTDISKCSPTPSFCIGVKKYIEINNILYESGNLGSGEDLITGGLKAIDNIP